MEVGYASTPPEACDAHLLGCIVPDVATLPASLGALDDALGGALGRELERGRVRAGKGDVALVTGGPAGPHRIALAGLGSLDDGRAEALRICGARIATAARASRAESVALAAPDGTGDNPDPAADLACVLEGLLLGAYRNDRFKSGRGNGDGDNTEAGDQAPQPPVRHPASVIVLGATDEAYSTVQRASAIAHATNWARDLANCPANHLPPAKLADEAMRLADQHEYLSATWLDRAAIEAEGLGLLASVGQGSVNEPRLIVLEWNPPADASRPDAERLALIGKAITFDTGGISIKPSAGMAEMRLDKGGGCAVLGAMRAIAEVGIQRRVLAVIASAENMPGGRAYKPGDVIVAHDGTTVEVTNTDAEGRLVLGDAICWARKLGCGRIAEVSTLTGAMVVSLGHHFAGLVARDNEWTATALAAARRTGDHAWHLPMHNAYKAALKSDIADMANWGVRAAGSLYAALFLEHFARDTPFVHFDIAGIGSLSKPQACFTAKGASGWGVRAFTELAATY